MRWLLDFTQPGLFYRYTLTNDTIWSFTNHIAGRQLWLQITEDDTGGWTNSWPVGVLWPGGKPIDCARDANNFTVYSVLDNGEFWLLAGNSLGYTTNHYYAISSQNVDARVRAGNVSLSGVTNLTIEYWAKLPATLGPRVVPGGTILSLCGSVGTWSFANVFLWCGNLIWDDLLVYGGSSDNYGNFSVTDYASELTDGNWHHVAAVYDGSEYRLYLDGTLRTSESESITLPAAMDVWVLSYDWFSTHNEHTAGTMDEVRISKTVRYSADFPPATSFAVDAETLVYLKLNEGKGTTYTDATGNTTPVYVGNPPEWVDGVRLGGSSSASAQNSMMLNQQWQNMLAMPISVTATSQTQQLQQ
jgi:hypothetical protein